MACSINPNMEKSRGKAIYDLLVNKVPLLVVVRKWGVKRVTIWSWLKKWQELNKNVSQECINRPKFNKKICSLKQRAYFLLFESKMGILFLFVSFPRRLCLA